MIITLVMISAHLCWLALFYQPKIFFGKGNKKCDRRNIVSGKGLLLLLLLSCFSRFRLCATPWTAAHQAPPSLGFSRREHWSGLPVPSAMHESEQWKWSRSVVSDSSQPHGLQPTRLLCPWDFPGKSLEWVAIAFSVHLLYRSFIRHSWSNLCENTW